jgi:hypothetical protein
MRFIVQISIPAFSFINTTLLLPASGKKCMYLYVIIHNNKNATVAGCSALEIGAMVDGFLPNEPILEWSAGVLTGMAPFDIRQFWLPDPGRQNCTISASLLPHETS